MVAPATGDGVRRRGGPPQGGGRMADGLLEAVRVRGLHLAHPELGPKPLLAKLRDREEQPDLAAGNKEVRPGGLKAGYQRPQRGLVPQR